MHLTVNDAHYPNPPATEFEALIEQSAAVPDLEIWLYKPDGPSLCALLNANGGWLMFLPEAEDPGFSSRNPEAGSNVTALETYRLANGQEDAFPREWAFERSRVFDELREFFRTGRRPASVTWRDDGAG